MGLRKDILIHETEYNGVYISFNSLNFTGFDSQGLKSVHGILFVRQRKGDDHVIAYYECNFMYDLSSPKNLWEQAYDAAKEVPELAGAIDVLD